MSCPCNIKKTLWGLLGWEGRHKVEYCNIRKDSDVWRFTRYCQYCESNEWDRVNHADAIRLGFVTPGGEIIEGVTSEID